MGMHLIANPSSTISPSQSHVIIKASSQFSSLEALTIASISLLLIPALSEAYVT